MPIEQNNLPEIKPILTEDDVYRIIQNTLANFGSKTLRVGTGNELIKSSPDGFQIGNAVFSSAPFRVTLEGALTATSATISGAITAITGAIGGFDIGADYIRDTANTMGLASTVTGGDDVRFWAGASFVNRATAPFRVTEAGAVTATNFSFTGGNIGSAVVAALGSINVAARGWSQTCVFSVTDADTIAWGSGTLTSADGTAYSISAGNTGNMSAKTYIYLDTAVSTTIYQTTTTATTARGAGKVIIGVAQNGTGEATFFVLEGQGGQNIDASSIVANSITANELSTSILYAGSLIIDTAGLIRSGQTDYNTGVGWWLGNAAGTPKFSIGKEAGSRMTWDGSKLITVGGFSFVGSKGDGFGVSGNNGGVTRTPLTTRVGSNASNDNDYGRLLGSQLAHKSSFAAIDYDTSFEMYINELLCDSVATRDDFWGIQNYSGTVWSDIPDDATSTNRHVGFYLQDATLYVSNANGTTQTRTSVSVTLTNKNQYSIIFTAGVSVKFYINGTIVATHTTNLPSGSTDLPTIFIGATNSSNSPTEHQLQFLNNYQIII